MAATSCAEEMSLFIQGSLVALQPNVSLGRNVLETLRQSRKESPLHIPPGLNEDCEMRPEDRLKSLDIDSHEASRGPTT